ncbi:MAG: hypothetical protein ACRBFS_12750 [Aureispira sp.]
MEIAGIREIKASLKEKTPEELLDICLKMAKYKKENKEYLTYLLYEAGNETSYIESIKRQITAAFEDLNRSSFYQIKKSVRKILRLVIKYIRYSKKKDTEVQLRLFFCQELIQMKPSIKRSTILKNMYYQQLKVARKALEKLHEDLQYDYEIEIQELEESYRQGGIV